MDDYTNNIFFVVGCGRSGTTSLCRVLDSASNTECLLEPSPNLNRESRDMMEGRYERPFQLIAETVLQRAAVVLDKGLIYGEKNVTLGPFIPHLQKISNCRFVYVHRDGRDVVRSLLDWHNRMFGTIYRECKEVGDLSDRAKSAQASLPIELDSSDYSRPRPGPDDIWYDHWENFSRLEMCAWYWSRINALYLDKLEALPENKWISINYTSPDIADLLRVAEFLELEGLSPENIKLQLGKRINSLKDRIDEGNNFPRWPDWAPIDRIRFENIAARTMQRLGHYHEEYVRYCPPNYGEWWKQNEGGLEWYTWMYDSRLAAHNDFQNFVKHLDQTGRKVESLLDVGCGLAVGYADVYSDRRYVGMDLSGKEAEWCRQNRSNTKHAYITGDIIVSTPDEKFDVVFSHGTIDNSYDMDAMLKAMVACSNGWIYLTAYRGWFPELPEHRYSWDEGTTCFYNDISVAAVHRTLESLGCVEITVSPLDMGIREGNPIRYETRIVARVTAVESAA